MHRVKRMGIEAAIGAALTAGASSTAGVAGTADETPRATPSARAGEVPAGVTSGSCVGLGADDSP